MTEEQEPEFRTGGRIVSAEEAPADGLTKRARYKDYIMNQEEEMRTNPLYAVLSMMFDHRTGEHRAEYKEIVRLHDMLTEAGIDHDLFEMQGGYCIKVWSKDNEHIVLSAIEHNGSYGNTDDLIEIKGLLTPEEEEDDEVIGYLTAENVLERIKKAKEEGTC